MSTPQVITCKGKVSHPFPFSFSCFDISVCALFYDEHGILIRVAFVNGMWNMEQLQWHGELGKHW